MCSHTLPNASWDIPSAVLSRKPTTGTSYSDEIADALPTLARLITEIVHGEPGDNVVPFIAQ